MRHVVGLSEGKDAVGGVRGEWRGSPGAHVPSEPLGPEMGVEPPQGNREVWDLLL